jgi:VWFA-related protein
MHPARSLPLIFATLAVAGLAAQQKPVFRSSTEYVTLDVVVTDKEGKAVRDLTKDDFVVTERGKGQVVTDLQFFSIPPVKRTIETITSAVPTIDVAGNAHSPAGRQWVLVIDDLHIIELHVRHTKKVVQEFLESLPPVDQVAIVFVGRSDLSQDFTNDLGAQLRTVDRIKSALGFAPDAADSFNLENARGGLAGGMVPYQQLMPSTDERQRWRYGVATIDVLQNVAKSMERSTFPRKALVYVSEGMTYAIANEKGEVDAANAHAREISDRFVEVFERIRRNGVPVYSIDPRGLPDCSAYRGGCGPIPGGNIPKQQQLMRTIAENTGGLAFVNNSDITRAVRELIEDNSSFYVLGYYPDPSVRDGKFHDVDVKVKRPGLRIRAKDGYTAPSATPPTPVTTRQALDDILSAPLAVADLSLRAFAAPIAATASGMKAVVTLEVTYPAPLDGSKIDDTLQVGAVAIDHDGKIHGTVRTGFRFSGSPNGQPEVTYVINTLIDVPAKVLTLRVGVASQTLDRVGSVHIPLEVINPAADKLQISGVVIGFAGEKRQDAMPPRAFDGILPFQPTTSRTFEQADTLQIFAAVHGKRAAEVQVGLAVHGGSKPLAVNGTTLPLKDLAPGAYTLEVMARLPDGQSATRSVAFTIK